MNLPMDFRLPHETLALYDYWCQKACPTRPASTPCDQKPPPLNNLELILARHRLPFREELESKAVFSRTRTSKSFNRSRAAGSFGRLDFASASLSIVAISQDVFSLMEIALARIEQGLFRSAHFLSTSSAM